MIKASYFERIVSKAQDLKYCHCESADKQAKQSGAAVKAENLME